MKNTFYTTLITLILTLTIYSSVWGQSSCLPDGINFSSQTEIDNFPVNYPGCVEIEGNVAIGGTTINNLHGLSQIEAIHGNLTILFTFIPNLEGLESIKLIDGNFTLRLTSLTSLAGLDNLEKVSENFIIENNPIISISGLTELKHVGRLRISDNSALEEISGFHQLESVKSIYITNNPALSTLQGFSILDTISERFDLANGNLVSIDGFDNLNFVGSLAINSLPNIQSFGGITNVKNVPGSIELLNLISMETIPKFDSLTHIGGTLRIQGLPELIDFYSFNNLLSIGSILELRFLNSIVDVYGFDNLKSVGGIVIRENSNLEALNGFEAIEKLNNGRIFVINNENLKNIDGLAGLDSCSHGILIGGNFLLESIDGINNLVINDEIMWVRILNNPLLSTCNLDNLCPIIMKIPPDDISGNAPGCDYTDILHLCGGLLVQVGVLLDVDGDCEVGNPLQVSNSVNATLLQDGFTYVSSFQGYFSTFGVFSESPFTLSISGINNTIWEVCENEITIDPAQHGDTILVEFILRPIANCPELIVDLGLPPTFRGCLVTTDVKVGTQNTGTVPAENVLLSVVIPFDLMEVDAANPSPVAQSGDTLFFALGDLDVFENRDVLLTLRTRCDTFLIGHTICLEAFAEMDNPCPPDQLEGSIVKTTANCIGNDIVRFTLTNIGNEPTTSPHQYFIIEDEVVLMIDTFSLNVMEAIDVDVDATGSTFRMEATKLPDGSITAAAIEGCGGLSKGMINAFWLEQGSSNYATGCRQVTLAYDPNDKLAIPSGVGPMNLLAANRPIEYTIRFQNTGTDTAYRVLLTDVLPPQMAVSSFRPGFASHDYTWEILNDTLQVLFFPIALPDSAASLEGSQGFFTFSMDQKPDLPDGTLIQNTAAIIFDFNPPIITNTVFHTIGKLIVSIDHPQLHSDLWQLHGNPTRELAVFRSPTSIPGKKQFALFDMMGRTMRMDTFDGHEYVFHRGILGSGMYMFRITDAEGRPFTGLIVVAD